MGKLVEFENDELETITEMLREYRAALVKGEISSIGYADQFEIAQAGNMIGKLERAAQ
jgi:hypothetical protein